MRAGAQRRPGGRDQSRYRAGGKAGDGAVGRSRAPRPGGEPIERCRVPDALQRYCGARLGLPRHPAHFLIVTSVTPLTRLLASSQLPSRVTEVLRTMLPPPGIAQLWNFSVLGSKRTTVFGVEPDSLYQMISLIAERPLGSDFGPLGDCHWVTLAVGGSRL